MTDHFIPFRQHDILHLVHEDAPGGSAFTNTITLLSLIMRQEFQDRLERLKNLYQDLDPNADTKPVPAVGVETPVDPLAFSHELKVLLERANYRALSQAELDHALTAESVFQVKLHIALDDFRELTIYTRSQRQRQETISTWFGLKTRTLDVAYFERVLLYVRFQDAAYFAARKTSKSLPFKPGTTQLKLFANVPAADLEMLFPNSEVRMKTFDKLVIGVPALAGFIGIALKIGGSAAILFVLLKHWLGLHPDSPAINGAVWAAIAVAAFTLTMFVSRQLGRYKFKKIQFLQALANNLFSRNLDNNAGVIHRVLDEAQEEDIKEAALAYRFLLAGPATEAELDQRIEGWFVQRLQTTLDFEVDDALEKLARLGLASLDGQVWTALAPAETVKLLHERWKILAPA